MSDQILERSIVWIARLEGASLLFLFFVAMPLKYGAGQPLAVEVGGWAHGLLFLAFVCALGVAMIRLNWSKRKAFDGFVSAFLPFGTYVWERRYTDA